MDKGIKNVWGNRVYLSLPDMPDTRIEIDSKLRAQLDQERAKQYESLEVFAVGDTVTNYKKGDKVYVDPESIKSGLNIVKIQGKPKLIVSSFYIAHTWEE